MPIRIHADSDPCRFGSMPNETLCERSEGNREHRRDAYDTLDLATCVTLRPSEKYHRRPRLCPRHEGWKFARGFCGQGLEERMCTVDSGSVAPLQGFRRKTKNPG
jgi:hypothetical protein